MKEQIQKAADEYAERGGNLLEYSDNWQEYNDYDYVTKAFIAGAEYGYKSAVEKACKWLEECGGYVVNGQKCNYENFMKAMEEEE